MGDGQTPVIGPLAIRVVPEPSGVFGVVLTGVVLTGVALAGLRRRN